MNNLIHFHISVEKKEICFHTRYAASKTLLTIDERGSEIATTSVFDCQSGDLWQSKSLFLFIFGLRSIDVFDCHQSDVNSLYASLCYGGHFCIQLNNIIWNCLCLKGRYITMTI